MSSRKKGMSQPQDTATTENSGPPDDHLDAPAHGTGTSQPDGCVDPAGYKYWAFISYSHSDTKWAARLHSELETYRVPRSIVGRPTANGKAPPRLVPVFRDRDELACAGELGGELKAALARSRYLIVICSPRSARSKWVGEEVRHFKSLSKQNEGRVMCFIVDGEPNATDASGGAERECLPLPVRFRLSDAGELTSEQANPVAADARRGRDGRKNSTIKLLAGILAVGYDELRQREKARTLRRRLRAAVMWAVLLVVGFIMYVAAADAGLKMPGGEALRTWLDRRGASVLRPVPSDATVRRLAADQRQRLIAAIADHRLPTGWLPRSFNPPPTLKDQREVWSHMQATAALLRAPDTRPQDLRTLVPAMDLAFQPDYLLERDGIKYGWLPYPENTAVTTAPPALWTAIALSSAIGRPGLLLPAERQRCERWLEETEQVLRNYRPKATAGGWAMFPLQSDPSFADSYTGVLALMALLEARHAGVPWDGSAAARDALLAATANWLIQHFDPTGNPPGWQGSGNSAGVIFDGLTLQIYATLLRAEAGAGVVIPAQVLQAIPSHLIDCGGRPLDYPIQGQKFYSLPFTNHGGVQVVGSETVSLTWHPWAIECCARWLDRASRHPAPPEQVTRVRRALGHLVVDLGPEAERRAESEWVFVASETAFCLSAVPSP
jgi:hypothetical protein